MPRTVRDQALDSATARLRLQARRDPYWRLISSGRHVGYRRPKKGAGRWVARYYDGIRYVESTLATADDHEPANGQSVLDLRQAQVAAQNWFEEQEARRFGAAPTARPCTVDECVDSYLRWLAINGKSRETATYIADAHIRPRFGPREARSLTSLELRTWLQDLVEGRAARRDSGRPGSLARFAARGIEPATANRIWTVLRATLNLAFRDGRVPSDAEWRKVRPFRQADQPKVRWLDRAEAKRLLDHCAPDLRALAAAALYTGCRYGELATMTVDAYRDGSIAVATSKSGRSRTVYLNDEGRAFFDRLTAGRRRSERMFVHRDGSPWGKSHQNRPMKLASVAAGIDPPISFHVLRHTYASLYLMSHGDLAGLSKQLGHADTRMTIRHYGHLADRWRREEAEKHAPSLGIDVTAVLATAAPAV